MSIGKTIAESLISTFPATRFSNCTTTKKLVVLYFCVTEPIFILGQLLLVFFLIHVRVTNLENGESDRFP